MPESDCDNAEISGRVLVEVVVTGGKGLSRDAIGDTVGVLAEPGEGLAVAASLKLVNVPPSVEVGEANGCCCCCCADGIAEHSADAVRTSG